MGPVDKDSYIYAGIYFIFLKNLPKTNFKVL